MATPRPEPRLIHVFIASPGDLAVERQVFKDVIHDLNSGFGDGAGVRFVALGWEDTLATTGRRPQGVINRDVDRSDVFVLALHRRWGQEAPDAKPYSSYTEEEFHRAMDRWKNTHSPEIFVFFKHPGQTANPDPQLQKVLTFRQSLEDTRQVFPRFFADYKEFAKEIDRHLRVYAKGELPKADAPRERVLLPLEYINEVAKAKAEAQKAQKAIERAEAHKNHAAAASARADKLALDFAEEAATAAREGHVEKARKIFAKAQDGTSNLSVLYLAFRFYHLTGDLKAAEDMLERWLAISGPEAVTRDTAGAYGNLGIIYLDRGELGRAEGMFKRALAIHEQLSLHDQYSQRDGMANAYGNLGLIYRTHGRLEAAAEMHQKALNIHRQLNRQESMAGDYANLGLIYWDCRELMQAKQMFNTALAIYKQLRHREGRANQWGNLGLIYHARGQLERAKKIQIKSLAIHTQLGNQRGMASAYSNLGLIYQNCGDLERAEELYKKALAILEWFGNQEDAATAYGNLGAIYQTHGQVTRAEEMFKKSLAIFKSIGAVRRVQEVEGLQAAFKEI